MKIKSLSFIVAVSLLGACSTTQNNSNVDKKSQQSIEQQVIDSESKKLNQIFDDYFNDGLALNPISATFIGRSEFNNRFSEPLSEASVAKQLKMEQDYLKRINLIDYKQLLGQDLLSYEIFKTAREQAIKGAEFPSHLMPLSQMNGIHNFYPVLGSGQSAQPFNTKQDYLNFIKRSEGFVVFMDSVIEMYRKGIKEGVVQPKAIVEKVIPQLKAHVVDNVEDSVFYGPLKNVPDSISEEDKKLLVKQYKKMISEKLIPSYKKVYDFMRNEYLPQARDSVGQSQLPNGRKWYEHMILSHTTLSLTAEEIHQFGKAEVARILTEMKQVKQTVGFKGDIHQFFTFLKDDPQFYFTNEQEVLDGYLQTKEKINALLPKLFDVAPKADYVVKPVEAFRAQSAAGASYQGPAPDGSRPGIFYINTYNLKAQPKFLLETLSIHEAAPGHHFQIALQQEVGSLPMFRRFGGYTVFAEGWALYAESLGKELGVFTDPYMWYGRLVDEQLRAMRLVIDTGIHAFGWTREQAIQYMKDNSSMAESDIVSEVERYISWPGQALAYKIGQRAIQQLRGKSLEIMGDNFDIKKFHTQILIDGSLPMPVLEKKIIKWAKENS